MIEFSGVVGLAILLLGCSGGSPGETFKEVSLDPLNEGGAQFETPSFDVAKGEEVQDCYFYRMPDLDHGQDYWVDRIRLGTNPGTHHTNVFRVKTVVDLGTPDQGDFVHNGECFRSSNWADWPLITNNQQSELNHGYFDWKLPDGVAYRFSPGERIMIQTHFVNASTQKTPFKGKAVLDLYPSDMTHPLEMGTLFATQQSIRVCRSNPTPSFHGTCAFNTSATSGPITIAAANGHFHSRGTRFEIFKWDGVTAAQPSDTAKFYQSDTWDDPPMDIYSDPAPMKVDSGGIWWTCAYQWQEPSAEIGGCAAVDASDQLQAGDCCYTFGPKVETNEHCNVFLYYYPKVANTDINCF